MVVIKAFGQVKEQVGMGEFRIEEEMQNVKSLRTYLSDKYPAISWSSVAIAVNKQYAQDQDPLHQGDEIALIPPVSGG
ncbi:MAG: molybdopterin converting factor subunit 1 [Cytophagales bacterium]|nr:molybdopterin converting factor subunit 1 [Cytophagales bacterium]